MSKEVKRRPPTRLTPLQWAQLLGMLKSGQFTQAELARKFNVSAGAIAKKRKENRGIKIGEDVSEDTVSDAIAKTVKSFDDAIAFNAEETASKMTESRRRSERRQLVLGRFAEKKFGEAIRNDNVESLGGVAKVIKQFQEIFDNEFGVTVKIYGFDQALNFDSNDDLITLKVEKMDENEIQEIVDRQNRAFIGDDDLLLEHDDSNDEG